MTETEIPQMHLSRDHIMAMTQVLNMLSQRLAEHRERRGRAAYGNAEHAARIADTQENPVVRPMTDNTRRSPPRPAKPSHRRRGSLWPRHRSGRSGGCGRWPRPVTTPR